MTFIAFAGQPFRRDPAKPVATCGLEYVKQIEPECLFTTEIAFDRQCRTLPESQKVLRLALHQGIETNAHGMFQRGAGAQLQRFIADLLLRLAPRVSDEFFYRNRLPRLNMSGIVLLHAARLGRTFGEREPTDPMALHAHHRNRAFPASLRKPGIRFSGLQLLNTQRKATASTEAWVVTLRCRRLVAKATGPA
jgi:hypothetical protein